MDRRPLIRPERPADRPAVHRVLTAAFPGSPEADLVTRLRTSFEDPLSLVAEVAGQVVGHVFFTPVTIRHEDSTAAACALGPMGVLPAFQRQGIGSRLVTGGLAACAARGDSLVFVVGHSSYYPRFGFEPAASHGIHFKAFEYDPYVFVLELRPGALQGVRGWLEYHPDFDQL